MLSKEWWEFHLTDNGWRQGSYKLDTASKTLAIPLNTKLTRRYYETMDHQLQLKNWFKDTFGDAEAQKELLTKHPYPKPEFKKYKAEK